MSSSSNNQHAVQEQRKRRATTEHDNYVKSQRIMTSIENNYNVDHLYDEYKQYRNNKELTQFKKSYLLYRKYERNAKNKMTYEEIHCQSFMCDNCCREEHRDYDTLSTLNLVHKERDVLKMWKKF